MKSILSTFILSSLLLGGIIGPGLLEKAGLEYDAGEFQESIRTYQQALKKYPDHSEQIHYNMGLCFLALDSTQQALAHFYLAGHPAQPLLRSQAHNQIGLLHTQAKDYPKAMQAFLSALKSDPENAEAAFNYELLTRLMAKEQDKPEEEEPQTKQGEEDDPEEDSNNTDSNGDETGTTLSETGDPGSDEKDPDSPNNVEKQMNKPPPTDDLAKSDPKKPINLEEARRLLEGMRENEVRFLQQLRRVSAGPNKDPNKPDW